MLRHLAQQWFLLVLMAALVLGFALPGPFKGAADAKWLSSAIVAVVLFLMALPLEFSAIWHTVRYPWAALLGSAVNYGLLPLIAWGASLLLVGDLAIGLILVAAIPCTLASAAVWTRRAGGNDAAALMVTVITNLSCFVLAPFWIALLIGRQVALDPYAMAGQLALLVVLPLVAGQLARRWRPLAVWATRHKFALSNVAQTGILTMVLFGAVHSHAGLNSGKWDDGIGVGQIVLMVVLCQAVHLVTLALGFNLARGFRLSRPDAIAVAFSGSQKTLMVGLYLANQYFDGGLTILPMVAYHVGQLVLDTVVAEYWRKRGNAMAPGQDGRAI